MCSSDLEKFVESSPEQQNGNASSVALKTMVNDQQHVYKNNSRLRMGSAKADPEQTVNKLKQLMSILIEARNQRNQADDGTQVVNVVITPNSNSGENSAGATRNQDRKVIFLKNPQVKYLLESALAADPNINSAALKIAAALESATASEKGRRPYISQHNQNHAHGDYWNGNGSRPPTATDSPSGSFSTPLNTPVGFPLHGSEFLNLQHPNLQFHQMLHKLVTNGSIPTSINATTKTNIINIFVLNFGVGLTAGASRFTNDHRRTSNASGITNFNGIGHPWLKPSLLASIKNGLFDTAQDGPSKQDRKSVV